MNDELSFTGIVFVLIISSLGLGVVIVGDILIDESLAGTENTFSNEFDWRIVVVVNILIITAILIHLDVRKSKKGIKNELSWYYEITI